MQYFTALNTPVVALPERQKNLHENLPYDILGDVVLVGFALLNELGHVTVLAILHDDKDLLLLPDIDPFDVTDNVWVVELAQTINFANYLTALFFRQMPIVYLLPTVVFLRSVLCLGATFVALLAHLD